METVTALSVINNAYLRLGIKAQDEDITADERAYAEGVLGALIEEMNEITLVPFDLDNIPGLLLVPMANLLASEIGPSFGLNGGPRGLHFARIMAYVWPDDRENIPSEPEYF